MNSKIRDKLKKKLLKWRADPVLFAQEAFGFEATDQQAAVMRSFARPGAKVAVASGHGVGKSSLMAILAMWHTLLFKDAKAAATAASATQLRDVLMAEVRKWVGQAHPWIRAQLECTTMRMSVAGNESTQFLTARTARAERPDALQGLHATHMAFFIDEAFGAGVRFFKRFLHAGRVFQTTFTGNSQGFFLEGHRNLALQFFNDICEAAPDWVAKLMVNNKEE